MSLITQMKHTLKIEIMTTLIKSIENKIQINFVYHIPNILRQIKDNDQFKGQTNESS